MAPTPKYDYDYIVIGGGSGGSGTARRAAQHGAKVAFIERQHRLGGTCVNVGCVPKKLMWYTADTMEKVKNAKHFGLEVASIPKFDWSTIKQKRDAYVEKLNGIYYKNSTTEGVDVVLDSWGSLVDAHTVHLKPADDTNAKERTITGEHICIAVGGYPTLPPMPGAKDFGITSDGFFDLKEQPKRVVVVGAGYIAIELAGIFHTLGSEVDLIIRGDTLLKTFDPMLQESLIKRMRHTGIRIHFGKNVEKVESSVPKEQYDHAVPSPKTVTLKEDGTKIECDTVLFALGRRSWTEGMGLEKIGVKLSEKGDIEVDDYQVSSVPNIYSIGDVTGKIQLTPVAIAAGRRLANRLFGGKKGDHLDYNNVPSVVFSEPPMGSVGLTEPEARKKHGDDKIKIYTSNFVSLSQSFLPNQEDKVKCAYKLVCLGPKEQVVGVHIIGEGSDEITQGFAVAVKMGATKQDLDDTVAIHPTNAEELVTMK